MGEAVKVAVRFLVSAGSSALCLFRCWGSSDDLAICDLFVWEGREEKEYSNFSLGPQIFSAVLSNCWHK